MALIVWTSWSTARGTTRYAVHHTAVAVNVCRRYAPATTRGGAHCRPNHMRKLFFKNRSLTPMGIKGKAQWDFCTNDSVASLSRWKCSHTLISRVAFGEPAVQHFRLKHFLFKWDVAQLMNYRIRHQSLCIFHEGWNVNKKWYRVCVLRKFQYKLDFFNFRLKVERKALNC